ncbi:diguanylate cyclase domain-containing protein [Lapidilactobacillus wuchangensis]|uniref:diguanylate cyclase domain-containing protein n=1 Tax=Lapidilactobacillus wuchangensis TaxID=2486001 RepID=UPI0013DDC479|nr:diguanylate cyclase [Lapidilactobacillus wuchangensis]
MNRKRNVSLMTDLSLLLLLTLFVVTTLYMTLTAHNVVVNGMYLAITALLVIATYFVGLTTGLILNLLFIFAQGSYMLYVAVAKKGGVDFQLTFWLLMPLLLSVTIYTLTYRQQQLQKENALLQQEKQQLSILDERTHLRTLTAYLEDATIYMDTSKRYDLNLCTIVVRLRYFDQVKRLLTDQQALNVIVETSKIIKGSTRGEDIVYLLDPENLTWAILLYTDNQGAQIVRDRILSKFDAEINQAADLGRIEVALRVGIAQYDSQTMAKAQNLMTQAEKELDYDV